MWKSWIKLSAKVVAVVCLCAGLLLPAAAPALAADSAPTATPAPTPPPAVSSPEHPLSYSSEWMELQPGAWHWYSFKYDFDDSGDTDGDSRRTPAQIRLDTEPADQAALLLLNGEQVRAWEHGEKLQGFGAATVVVDRERVKLELDTFCDANPNDPACNGSSDRSASRCDNLHDPASADNTCNYTLYPSRGYATWSGVIGASGTYYVLVRSSAEAAGPIRYRFTVSGDGMTMK